jgi:hypothetical protein
LFRNRQDGAGRHPDGDLIVSQMGWRYSARWDIRVHVTHNE